MKFYIAGGSGFMGSGMVGYLKKQGHEVDSSRIELYTYGGLGDELRLTEELRKIKPDVVINFAGVRAYPNIDWCEDNKMETIEVNVLGAEHLMKAALAVGAYPIQIASGCIYEGGPERQFTEEDEPNFTGSFYSRMRIELQERLKKIPVLQVRIRMPISIYPHPRNFIDKIVSYNKVISIPNSVTLIEDMYPALEKLATGAQPIGILNMVNEGVITHAQVLDAYKRIVDPTHEYELISLEQLQGEGGITKAKRSNCILSTAKAKSLGVEMPEINLEEIMLTYKNNK